MWLRRSHSELVLLRCSVVANFHKFNDNFRAPLPSQLRQGTRI